MLSIGKWEEQNKVPKQNSLTKRSKEESMASQPILWIGMAKRKKNRDASVFKQSYLCSPLSTVTMVGKEVE